MNHKYLGDGLTHCPSTSTTRLQENMAVGVCASSFEATGLLYTRSSIKVGLRIGFNVSSLLLRRNPITLLQHLPDLLFQCLIDLHLVKIRWVNLFAQEIGGHGGVSLLCCRFLHGQQ